MQSGFILHHESWWCKRQEPAQHSHFEMTKMGAGPRTRLSRPYSSLFNTVTTVVCSAFVFSNLAHHSEFSLIAAATGCHSHVIPFIGAMSWSYSLPRHSFLHYVTMSLLVVIQATPTYQIFPSYFCIPDRGKTPMKECSGVGTHTGDHSAHPEQSFARDAPAANTMAPTDGHRIRLLSRICWNCCRLCDFFWERNTQSKATFGWNGKNRYCHKTWVNLHYPLDSSVNQSTNYCNQSTCQPTNQPANGSINPLACLIHF